MPPEVRLLSLEGHLPGAPVGNEALERRLETSAEAILQATGIGVRHYAESGQGSSDLARVAAEEAMVAAGVSSDDLALIIFATATPDVTFPGAACFLQDKLAAGTAGALDVRAQSAGFIAGLELGCAFASVPGPISGEKGGASRVLLAAGEVFSSGLDESPRGADLTPRLADGAAVGVLGRSDVGARVAALRWYTDGTLADRFWCEFPASGRYPLRVKREDLLAGRHFPSANLESLAPIARTRLGEVCKEVAALAEWSMDSVQVAILDYVEPSVVRAVACDLGLSDERTDVPTETFAHVMAAGLPLRLAHWQKELAAGSRVLLAAAGPGFSWGAAALEL